MPYKNKEDEKANRRDWYKRNSKKVLESNKKYLEENPWQKSLARIRSRCLNKKHHYFKKGIKNFLDNEQIKFLWFRDNAFSMKKASIDRICSRGNYTIDNCRFIELEENIRRRRK